MAKKPTDSQPPVEDDRDLLSVEEIKEVELEAQEEIERELKAQARKSLKTKLLAEAKQKKGLAEPQDTVTVDLAPYADRILIDNRAYLQGGTYTVPVGRAQVIREAMQRTWSHQSEIDGKSENFYRRARAPRVVPIGNGVGVVNTSQLLKA